MTTIIGVTYMTLLPLLSLFTYVYRLYHCE